MTRVFRAPGRVNLIGEHTDYTGGLVLPVAIDRYVSVAGEPGGEQVRLTSETFRETVVVAGDGAPREPSSGWGRYVAAVVAELAALGRPRVGFSGAIRSDLPIGSGLSSSAALEVGVATALCRTAEFDVDPLALARACQRAEHRAVGVPSGIMDQAASLLGRGGHALLLDSATLEHWFVPLPSGTAILVVDSGVARRLEESAYALRRNELESALPALQGRRPADVSPAELDDLLAASPLEDVPARRLRHVVTENERVRRAVSALTAPGAADREALGLLFRASQASLRDDFEVSTPELDLLVDFAVGAGAFAARLTGAGFGGSIVALVDADRAEPAGREIADAYAEEAARRARWLVCRPADGAREVTPEAGG